ncbi:MAG: hydantoinase/oxoprolinase family protein [Pseudomonadota bacterium]|nr:hydantoinase/oxoprolinase family protein [Pseudomonadota bacterium]
MSGPYRLGVDVGGTHTDLVLLNVEDGSIQIEKVSSTPENPALGVLEGVDRFITQGKKPDTIEFFSHGTTITTNALLEMRGAKVGMIITKGYRAIQEIQQQARDGNPFDYFFQRPTHLAPQSLTFEAAGRVDFEGNVSEPLDEAAVRKAARALKRKQVSSIAVVYLFSYMNPEHEQRSRELILEEWGDAHISLSSDVLPRIREWPRMSTTLLNAYLEPVLVNYIRDLSQGLDTGGIETQQRFLMQSNGGVMPFRAAITGGKTVYTLFSGPAAGAQAAAYLAAEDAQKGLVTLDMGGTSCDIAFIEGGAPLEVTESEVARRRLDVPALDLTTISAGGGSIAWVDGGGLLAVGPHSAGAAPGPACYKKGGVDPTVTDADIACGFLNPGYFLGGAQNLDREASLNALKEKIGTPLGMSTLEAATGIRRIVDMRMADKIRVFGAKRGVDPQEFTLLPFGGAGAVHAAPVAEELAITRILVPPNPGAFSALGLLCTDVVHDYIRSELRPLAEVTAGHGEQIFNELEERGRRELDAEGMDATVASFGRELDMRYTGQGYELRVPLEGTGFSGGFDDATLLNARSRFDAIHARIHGHAAEEKPVEVVSYRVRARVTVPKFEPVSAEKITNSPGHELAKKGTREVWFASDTSTTTTIWDRSGLHPGATLSGPAIVEQFDSTAVIPAGWSAHVNGLMNLILTRNP